MHNLHPIAFAQQSIDPIRATYDFLIQFYRNLFGLEAEDCNKPGEIQIVFDLASFAIYLDKQEDLTRRRVSHGGFRSFYRQHWLESGLLLVRM